MVRTSHLNENWEFSCKSWSPAGSKLGFSVHEWRSACVPGHVHADLVRHGIIADPFVALHELGCQWVDEQDWSYRTEFDVELDPRLPRRLLRFEGLDTVCEVRLNGEVVANHDNMFLALDVEVSECLRDGKNELEVNFSSGARIGRERRSEYLTEHHIAETVRHFDDRAFVRKAQYMFGWDWGPRLVSAGIWRPVTLVEYTSRITDVQIRQEHLGDGSVRLAIVSQIEGPGEVVHYLEDADEPLHDGEVTRIARPKLWWPAGFGEQHRYTVTSVLVDSTAGVAQGRREADRRVTRFGLRRAQLLRVPDEFGESFEFEVNGKRVWALGANWIPDHSLPSAIDATRLRRQLLRARDMNMNMLRVWGGGYYESDEFYSLCDELGLMVWQDFPFACSYYPDDEPTLLRIREEASANVVRLRNHPSLVLWCGNNENSTMFESKWGGADNQPPRFFGQTIFDDVLPDVLAELDRSRSYVPSSPCGGSFSNCGGTGDQHTWDVWHGRGDWKYYADSTARFSSEFGFASAPSVRCWRQMLPDATDLNATSPEHAVARWHDKTAKGFDAFRQFVELHYPRSEHLEQWTYYSQLNQRDAMRFAIEHFRRSEFCRGTLIWQFNDCWPVQSWALVDFSGTYKAAAFELKRLYEPLLASLQVLEDSIRLWVVLDNTDEGFAGPVRLEAHCLTDGSPLGRWETHVELRPGLRYCALEVDLAPFDRRSTLISASLNGMATHRLLVEPRDVQMALATLHARFADDVLEITSELPVVDLHLWDDSADFELCNDFVTLPAGGSVRLRVRGTPSRVVARSLAGLHQIRWHSD